MIAARLSNMNTRPKIQLSRLRDIGWSIWDPIGLLEEGQSWDGQPFADEYDGYLLRAAGMVRRLEPDIDVVDYLIEVETEHMGLSMRAGVQERAAALVHAIKDDDRLWREAD